MKAVCVSLFSKKQQAARWPCGGELPEKATTSRKHYNIEMPDDDYQKLKSEAKKANITLEEHIFKKYRYANQLPKTWEVT